MSDEQAKFRDYPNTILEFAARGGPEEGAMDPRHPSRGPTLRVDLRAPIDAGLRAAIADLGLGEQFAVFTAENPEGDNAEDAPTEQERATEARANARRTRALEDALRDAGLPWRRVVGVAPDGEYREHCVAVPIARDDATALAARLRQLALFWYDGTRFWLLPAEAGEAPRALPAGPAAAR